MGRWVASACIGAILLLALIPGAAIVCIELPQLLLVAADLRERPCVVRQPAVAPALIALVGPRHMPRASLPAAARS